MYVREKGQQTLYHLSDLLEKERAERCSQGKQLAMLLHPVQSHQLSSNFLIHSEGG